MKFKSVFNAFLDQSQKFRTIEISDSDLSENKNLFVVYLFGYLF